MSSIWVNLIGAFTVLLLLTFVGIWVWAWNSRNAAAFSRLAHLPLIDDAQAPPAKGRSAP